MTQPSLKQSSKQVSARDPAAVPERVTRALQVVRRHGGRRTPQRVAVLQVLACSPGHLSVARIHAQVTALGVLTDRSSMNRTVATFLAWGLVHTLPVAGDPAYGLADPPHHHALCTHCGQEIEIPAGALAAARRAVEDVAEDTAGFAVHPTGLALHGLCSRCRARP